MHSFARKYFERKYFSQKCRSAEKELKIKAAQILRPTSDLKAGLDGSPFTSPGPKKILYRLREMASEYAVNKVFLSLARDQYRLDPLIHRDIPYASVVIINWFELLNSDGAQLDDPRVLRWMLDSFRACCLVATGASNPYVAAHGVLDKWCSVVFLKWCESMEIYGTELFMSHVSYLPNIQATVDFQDRMIKHETWNLRNLLSLAKSLDEHKLVPPFDVPVVECTLCDERMDTSYALRVGIIQKFDSEPECLDGELSRSFLCSYCACVNASKVGHGLENTASKHIMYFGPDARPWPYIYPHLQALCINVQMLLN